MSTENTEYYAEYRGSPVNPQHPVRIVGLYRRRPDDESSIDEVFHVDGTWHVDASLDQWLRGFGDVGVMKITEGEARSFIEKHAPTLDPDAMIESE